MKPFIVELWSRIFRRLLRWLSLLRIIRICIIPRIAPSFTPNSPADNALIEIWALGNWILSIILLFVCSASGRLWWESAVIVYALFRVVEILITQINVLLFEPYRAKQDEKPYSLVSIYRTVILLLHNYVEIIFWFAIIYRNLNWTFEGHIRELNSFFESLNLSFVTMTTFGQTGFAPSDTWSELSIFFQSVIGLFMSLAVLARFISLLPPPGTSGKCEE